MKKGIKIMSLNVFHGRYKVKGIPFFRKYGLLDNLGKISEVLKNEEPDVVLLQEIDNKSLLSGRFNHADAISKFGDMPYYFMGEHVKVRIKRLKFASYGTAILSKYEFKKTESQELKNKLPILKKGFVIVTVKLPEINVPVDIVSAHFVGLDLLPKGTRKKQAMELVQFIKMRKSKNPLIIGGDFNCGADEETLKYIADSLNLYYYVEDELMTFPSGKPRKCIDWIMVSPQLEIKDYYCVRGKVSDHLAVVTEVGLKNNSRYK